MRSRDERRLPDDEKYVLFFFFSSSFPLHSMEKYCLSFLSRVFVHHYQFLSLRLLLLLLRFFFRFFFSLFPVLRLSDSNDNKNRHSKQWRTGETRDKRKKRKHESNSDMATSLCHPFNYGAIILTTYQRMLDKCRTFEHFKKREREKLM